MKHSRGLVPYRRLEAKVMLAVAERFGLDPYPPAEVKRLDLQARRREVEEWLPEAARVVGRHRPLAYSFRPAWSPARARREFLSAARALGIS